MSVPRVLIVDDNAMNIAIAQVVLVADNFAVECAGNAAEALQKVDAFRPELILMDIQMPGMDGLQLTQLLKANPATQGIVVVAFTAFAMRGDEARLRRAGCDGYLSKPIEVHKFAQQVRALISKPAFSDSAL